jgi:hypothetical protein
VATPVCSWRTFCTIKLAIAEKERPMPMPSRPAGLEPAEREQLEGLLTSIWDRSGGYEAWSQVADEVEADEKAA